MKLHFSFYRCGPAKARPHLYLRWPFWADKTLYYILFHHRIHLEIGFKKSNKAIEPTDEAGGS
jgi:hypothetical protein